VSEWLLLNANSAIFRLYHDKNKLRFDEMMMMLSALNQTNKLSWIIIALTETTPRVDISLHSDTLFWFRDNQSLLFLLSAACLVEKLQIPIT
jgi:hypothetical protein